MKLADEKKYFEESFKAREYLKNYYSHIDVGLIGKYVLQKTAASETARIMIHLAEVVVPTIKSIFERKHTALLELGGGPTLYQLFSVAEVVDEIHFTDYTEDNLKEIRRWLHRNRNAFNWKPYAKVALMLKSDSPNVRDRDVRRLEDTLRKKIRRVTKCDIFKRDLGVEQKYYDVLNTHFAAESATSSKVAWRQAIANICRKIRPGGLLIMSALRGARGSYKVLGKQFPAVEIYENDLHRELKRNGLGSIQFTTMRTEDMENNYRGFIFVIAKKGAAPR